MVEAGSSCPAKAVISVPSLLIVNSAGPEVELDDSGSKVETKRIRPSASRVGSVMPLELKVSLRGTRRAIERRAQAIERVGFRRL